MSQWSCDSMQILKSFQTYYWHSTRVAGGSEERGQKSRALGLGGQCSSVRVPRSSTVSSLWCTSGWKEQLGRMAQKKGNIGEERQILWY